MTRYCPLGRDVCDSCTALSDLTVARCLSLVRFEFFFSVKVRKMATKGHMCLCLPAQRSTVIWPAADNLTSSSQNSVLPVTCLSQ